VSEQFTKPFGLDLEYRFDRSLIFFPLVVQKKAALARAREPLEHFWKALGSYPVALIYNSSYHKSPESPVIFTISTILVPDSEQK
jgi:hypothetical protein